MWNAAKKRPKKTGPEFPIRRKSATQIKVTRQSPIACGLENWKRIKGQQRRMLSSFWEVLSLYNKRSILPKKTSSERGKTARVVSPWEPFRIPPPAPITRCIHALATTITRAGC